MTVAQPPENDRPVSSPEETLRLTRELLARSRETLDEMARRLTAAPETRDGAADPATATG